MSRGNRDGDFSWLFPHVRVRDAAASRRASMRTVLLCHAPRAVRTPRSFSALTMFL
jgi:hypothetical protein